MMSLLLAAHADAQEQRVVSIGGAITEIVYALGAEKKLVAVDTTSLHPKAALQLPKVGYMRTLSAEGVLSTHPTLVLATSEAGPPAVIAQLKSAGVKLDMVSADHSFDELRNKVRAVAQSLAIDAEGRKLDEALQRDWATVTTNVAKLVAASSTKPRVLFILSNTGINMMVSGEGSAGDAMIRYAGGINAMQGFKGYKPMTSEAVLAAAPDVVLVTQQGLDAVGGADKLWQHAGLALTPAAKKKHLVAMEALYLLGFGPRLPQAVGELAQKLRTPS